MKTRQEQRTSTFQSADDLFFHSYAQEIKQFDNATRYTIKQKIARIFMEAETSTSENRVGQNQRVSEIQTNDYNQYYRATTPSTPADLPVPSLTTLQNINYSQILERDLSFQNM